VTQPDLVAGKQTEKALGRLDREVLAFDPQFACEDEFTLAQFRALRVKRRAAGFARIVPDSW
jgi:hypothetical protein